MKRTVRAIICCAVLLAGSATAHADPASDRDMANRYLQAARSGDDDAQFYLGALYSAGVGVPRSDEEAFRWFARAADQGHSHAMLVLSGIYAVGRGVPQDNLNAYKWAYIVSVGTRVEEFRNGSRQLMGVLESRMTREDIDRAKAQAGRWHAVTSQAKPAGPADNFTRDSQSPQPSAAVSKEPAVTKQAPANTTSSSTASGNLSGPRISSEKQNDMDALLDRVPSGLRKRFGF